MRLKEKKILKKFAATLKKFSAQGAKKVEYGIYCCDDRESFLVMRLQSPVSISRPSGNFLLHNQSSLTTQLWRLSYIYATVKILCIGTDRSQQTVQTLIRLLLQKQSDQGLRCLPLHQLLLDALMQCYIKL